MEEIPRKANSNLAKIVSGASGIAYTTGMTALGRCCPETVSYMFSGAMASLPCTFAGFFLGSPGVNSVVSCGIGGAVGGAIGGASTNNTFLSVVVGAAVGGALGTAVGVSFESAYYRVGRVFENARRFLGYAVLSGALIAGGSFLENILH